MISKWKIDFKVHSRPNFNVFTKSVTDPLTHAQLIPHFYFPLAEPQVTTLTELAAKCVASFIPFELVEHVYPPVPEQLQLRIAYWSFPDNEEDIRLYSCLANSSADEFHRGDQLFKNRLVKDSLQIGLYLKMASNVGEINNFEIIFRFPFVSNSCALQSAKDTVQRSRYVRSTSHIIM